MTVPDQGSRLPSLPTTRQASLCLDFILVGGGVGGLACAYALASVGHHVRVLERRTLDMPTSSTAIRAPPNLSKILASWGILEELRAKSIPCRDISFNDFEFGNRIGCLTWRSEVLEETGGDYLMVHHRDLYDMLYRIATQAGAEIIHGVDVVRVIPGDIQDDGSDRLFTASLAMSQSTVGSVDLESTCVSVTGYGPPSVVLASGEVFTADIVVGVDGSESLVREVVLRPESERGTYTNLDLLSVTYTVDQLKSDPELRRLVDEPIWDIWMGNDRSVMGYPAGNGQEYALTALFPRSQIPAHEASEVANDWEAFYPHELFAEMFKNANCTPIVQKVAKLPAKIARAKYIHFPRCEQWVHDSRTIALMAEAAHPNVPCSNQSVAMCVEDAAVFGALFSRLRSWDQVPLLMEAYQDIRQDRTEFVAIQDLTNVMLCQVPPGPDRDARDERLQRNMYRGLEGWDDEMLQEQWDGMCEVFAYSALDAAADWWACWGKLGELAKERNGEDRMEISVCVAPEPQNGAEGKPWPSTAKMTDDR